MLATEERATVAQFAEAAGVSRTAFYRAFESRSALLEALAVQPEPAAKERILEAALSLVGAHGLGASFRRECCRLGRLADVADLVVDHIKSTQPDFTFAAMVGIDKTSHAFGQPSPLTDESLRLVDATAARIRADAERDGRWSSMHLWVTSDHGHSPVKTHEDLAGVVAGWGFRTVAHPWVFTARPEVAVMVSGNAMAHLYVDVRARQRTYWSDMPARARSLVDRLLERASVDLIILPHGSGATIRSRDRGDAEITTRGDRFSLLPPDGRRSAWRGT